MLGIDNTAVVYEDHDSMITALPTGTKWDMTSYQVTQVVLLSKKRYIGISMDDPKDVY